MSSASYTTSIDVDQTPEEVFDAVVDVRSWWVGDFDGSTEALGDEFTYSVPGIHWNAMRVTELARGQRVAWLVTDSRLQFTQVPDEWTGTTITFDIAPLESGTRLTFTHEGLVPAYECFIDCSNAWGSFVHGSLLTRIAAGPSTPPRSSTTGQRHVVEEYLEGFRTSDHGRILATLTDDVVWVIHGHRTTTGKAEFDGEIENPGFSGTPELRVDLVLQDGAVVITTGEGRGLSIEHGAFRFAFNDLFTFRDGLIARVDSYVVPLP